MWRVAMSELREARRRTGVDAQQRSAFCALNGEEHIGRVHVRRVDGTRGEQIVRVRRECGPSQEEPRVGQIELEQVGRVTVDADGHDC